MLVEPVDWVEEVAGAVDSGANWILDVGPGDLLTRMTSSGLRGTGTGILPAATRGGQRNLLTPGARPEVSPAWSTFAPTAVTLPDGRTVTETSFTRLTGRSPILLAGMTPTTVDAAIVAAAANAGHWAELAGGGQVTEQIFADRVAELRTLLEPGREVQFNSLFLDPYLWKLQLGGKRLVQRARAAGAPFDGVVVTAGIPELEEAVALIEELAEANISYVAFKPGTIAQIRSVIRIANEVPDYQVIVHVEGGRAGGHHSWEDLDDLLLGTYAELRTRPNVIVCVGGGIGTPERAAEYLTGTWSLAYGFPEMPLDGILVGTAAMATLEATTAPEVKQLLVDTPGTPDWVGAGTAVGGMASGRSQLGADIHEIDNTASRCGRLLDDVAGDADAVAARRDEIIEALNGTAKPYFGDVETMTYTQWLQRYVEVSIGGGESTAAGESLWLDITWRDRFASMLQRAEARLNPADRGEVPTLFADEALLEDPPRPSPPCARPTPTPTPRCCTRPTCRSSSRCAAPRASRSTSCRSSTRTCAAGGVRTRCGRRTTRATRPIRCASSPAPSRSPASPGSTSRWASCSTASRRPPPTRCSPLERQPRASRAVAVPPSQRVRSTSCSPRPTSPGPAASPRTRSRASARPPSGPSTAPQPATPVPARR